MSRDSDKVITFIGEEGCVCSLCHRVTQVDFMLNITAYNKGVTKQQICLVCLDDIGYLYSVIKSQKG